MVMNTMMRILVGMSLRMELMITLEPTSTKLSARHMIRAGASWVVTASAEQMPRICSVIGLLSTTGSNSACFDCLSIQPPSGPLTRTRARNGPKPCSPSQ